MPTYFQENHEAWDAETSRWTSSSYRVRFDTVGTIDTAEGDEEFNLSAWGISRSLRQFLVDYNDFEILEASHRAAMYQNTIVIDVLDDMMRSAYKSGKPLPRLENTFIAIEVEMYLPRGLKVPVCCVTNIVPGNGEDDTMDKFVAVLDPAEARAYIDERAGPLEASGSTFIH